MKARSMVSVFLLAASGARAQMGAGQPPSRGDDPGGALAYFRMLRVNPDGRIPAGARNAALAEMRLRWPRALAQRDALLSSTPNLPNTVTWQPLGPTPINASGQIWSGRLNAIAIDPNNPQRIFVGGAQGGVWRTTDGGTTWTPLTDSQCSLAMGSVAIDPQNSNVIYAGTGELNNSGDSYYGCGVLKSTDGGDHWAQVPASGSPFQSSTGTSARIAKIVVDRTNSSNLLVAASSGMWRSTDAGATWAVVIRGTVSGQPGIASDVVQDPINAATFYGAQGAANGAANINGVWKSVDGGVTWALLAGFPTTNVGRINLSATTAGGDGTNPVVWAAVQNSSASSFGQLLGIYKSIDGGTTWTVRNPTTPTSGNTMCSAQCWYSMVIAADPATPNLIFFGGLSLYKSTDGGSTFNDIGRPIHVDQHAFAFGPSPSTLYAGNDGGIFVSSDTGATWSSLNAKLALTQFYNGISVSPSSSTTVLGGSQDNGTLQWGGVGEWPQVLSGDGGFTALDQITGGTAFGETQWTVNSGFSGPRRRDVGGSQFNLKTTGINLNDPGAFMTPLVMDPFRPNVLFFGTRNLYRTSSSGDLWTLIGNGLVASSGVITAIGVAPSDSTTVYVGSSDARVVYTHDLGGTWVSATGLPTAAVTDFAVDPRDARTAVATFGGFLGSHVWKTTNGGASWTNLTFDLPNIPTLAVVVEPGSGDVDIGTDVGVFTLRSGTQTWAPVVNGLPNVAVYGLVFDAARSRLIAATHGRGMFSLDVTVTALRGDVAGSGPPPGPDNKVDVLDAQAILAMVVGNPPPTGTVRYPNGDANCDGQITALDALVVLMKAANINTGTCVGTIH